MARRASSFSRSKLATRSRSCSRFCAASSCAESVTNVELSWSVVPRASESSDVRTTRNGFQISPTASSPPAAAEEPTAW
eukprot:5019844-Prymnesium_polylepis.1